MKVLPVLASAVVALSLGNCGGDSAVDSHGTPVPTATAVAEPTRPPETARPTVAPVVIPALDAEATAVARVFASFYDAMRARNLDAAMALVADGAEICFRQCHTTTAAIRAAMDEEFRAGRLPDVTITSVAGNSVQYRWKLYEGAELRLVAQGTGNALIEGGKIRSDK